MASENLEAMLTQLVVQQAPNLTETVADMIVKNAPQIGRALAQVMLNSLIGKGLPAGLGGADDVGSSPSHAPIGRRPGSAAAANQKILDAIPKKGASIQEIVTKTNLPVSYIRSRLGRLMRDQQSVVSKGTTSKTRYFRAE